MTKICSDKGYRDLTADPVRLGDGSLLTEPLSRVWDREVEQRLERDELPIDRAVDADAPKSP